MQSGWKEHRIRIGNRTGKDRDPQMTPRQPHERDESTDSQESAPRRDIKQAYDDLMAGQVDTDLRGERGVDALVNKTPGLSPVNPSDVEGKNDAQDKNKTQH